MKILITEQFTKATKKLNSVDKKNVFKFFLRLEQMSKDDLFKSMVLMKVPSLEGKIYAIRIKFVRIFCTFMKDGNIEDLVLLDVTRKSSNRFSGRFNLTRKSSANKDVGKAR